MLFYDPTQIYSANDGRKCIHTRTYDGSYVVGCFENRMKTKFLMSVFAGERSKFAYSKMSSRLECRVGKL